jgi:hypothetical protein
VLFPELNLSVGIIQVALVIYDDDSEILLSALQILSYGLLTRLRYKAFHLRNRIKEGVTPWETG